MKEMLKLGSGGKNKGPLKILWKDLAKFIIVCPSGVNLGQCEASVNVSVTN